MSWIWVGIGYAVFLFNVYFEKYLLKIRQSFAPSADAVLHDLSSPKAPGHHQTNASSSNDDKKTPLVTSDTGLASYVDYYGESLPAWCFIDMDRHEQNRSWLTKALFGKGLPNRHHALYWLEKNGPSLHLLILRINLVFIGMYCAMLALVFLPSMYKTSSPHLFFAFIVISAVPMLAIIFNKKHLISTLVEVGCIGSFRLPQAVSQADREQKTAQVVRALVIIQKLHRAAERSTVGFTYKKETEEKHYSDVLDREEVAEVARTFDMFDKDGSEKIGAGAFQGLMSTMGTTLDGRNAQHPIIKTISKDDDGQVSKEEFLQWYANEIGKHDGLSMKERARFVFQMFDKDGNGDVSVTEFKEILDALNTNFSVDEVGELVNELDHHDRGVLREKEFQYLLEMYYPKELDVQEAPWACIICDPALPL